MKNNIFNLLSLIQFNSQFFDSVYNSSKRFGFSNFVYVKYFDNGKYLYLNSDIESAKFRLSKDKDPNLKSIEYYLNNNSNNLLFYTWSDEDKELHIGVNNSLISNGLSILTKHKGYLEIFCMTTPDLNENLASFYIENKQSLVHLSVEMHKKFEDFLTTKKDVENCFLICEETVKMNMIKLWKALCNNRKEFNAKIALNENIILNLKELQCIHLLSSLSSIKEISQNVNLSPKTVEKFLYSARRKIGVDDNYLMIKNYINNLTL